MGFTILPNDPKRKHNLQTCYYRAPEILMKTPYNNSIDIWALGCTIYEMLTSTILFDADSYEGNQKRHHLFLIACECGMFPAELMEKCHNKDIFFTSNLKRIKGYGTMINKNNFNLLTKIHMDKKSKKTFSDFIIKLFIYDIDNRLTAKDALSHSIFKKVKQHPDL